MLFPLHVPLQALPSLAQAVRAPCGSPVTAEHVPSLPGTSHASHCEPHEVLQQKPSMHSPEMHALPFGHFAPGPCLATHSPAEQKEESPQSLSTEQSVAQALPLQVPPQSCVNAGGQLPRPSQNALTVATPLSQLASRQEVPTPG